MGCVDMFVIKMLISSVVLLIGLLFFTLYRNDANLFDTPGIQQRVTTFMTSNVAETKDDHAFKELTTPVFDEPANLTYQLVIDAATELGWNVVIHDSDNQNASFVVRSPVFLYEDDVLVQVQFLDMNRSSVHIHSSSRKGKGDLAANSSHIQRLLKKMRNQ